MSDTETTTTPAVPVPDAQVAGQAGRYARNDPASFAAGEETTPEKDAIERGQHPASFAAGEETTPVKDAAERAHPGSFGDGEETTPEKDAAESRASRLLRRRGAKGLTVDDSMPSRS